MDGCLIVFCMINVL